MTTASVTNGGDPARELIGSEEASPSVTAGCDLVVVPPRRTVFISRLSADTSVEKVESYIRSRCGEFNQMDCRVFKFNFSQQRDIASFRAIVPSRIFETLVSQSFWPPGVLVREFVPRDRPRRVAAIDLHPPSKN